MRSEQLNMSKRPPTPLSDPSTGSASGDSSSSSHPSTATAHHAPRSSRSTPPPRDLSATVQHSISPPELERFEKGKQLVSLDFRRIVVLLRERAEGLTCGGFGCLLTLEQYRALKDNIKSLLEGDSLRAFWKSKLRYDYDSESQLFRVLMGDEVHEGFLAAVSKQIVAFLLDMERSETELIKNVALAIEGTCSRPVEYTLTKDSSYVSSSPILIPVSTSPKKFRSSSKPNAVVPLNEGLPSDIPEYSTDHSGSIPISPASDSTIVERHYSPDNSWMFQSSRVKDENATFIVEIVNTQRRADVMKKIENYFSDCHTESVLTCNISNDESQGGAYIEMWKPPKEGEPIQLSKRNPEWRVTVLDENGRTPTSQEDEARVTLIDFISAKSIPKYLDKDFLEEEIVQLTSKELTLDTVLLGKKLIRLREQKKSLLQQREERKLNKRRLSSDPTDNKQSQEAIRDLIRKHKRLRQGIGGKTMSKE